MFRTSACLAGALAVMLSAGSAVAVNIVFDYSLDTNNFFDTQDKRDALDAAAAVFEVFTDSLDAISPGTVWNPGTVDEFTDTWDANFTHPGTGELNYVVTDLSIPADTVYVYVGGRNLPGITLGEGGPGGFDVFGVTPFVEAVESRGQTGVYDTLPSDFGPWGGAITFDMPNDWHFDPNTVPGASQTDFVSVAIHEIAHLLGFGTALSWDVLSSTGTTFTGSESTALFGANPPLHFDQAHWQTGTTSVVPNGGPQETAMDPDISDGQAKAFTLLDFAAMADIGWQVPPMTGGVIAGDLDADGYVGITDLNIVLGNWNQTVAAGDPLLGDPSGDGFVGIDDLNAVLGNWNAGTPPGVNAIVPEPGSVTVLGAVGLALVRRRS